MKTNSDINMDRPLIIYLSFMTQPFYRMIGFTSLNQLLQWYLGDRVFAREVKNPYEKTNKVSHSALDPIFIARKDQREKWLSKIELIFSINTDNLRKKYESLINDPSKICTQRTFEEFKRKFLYGSEGLYTKKSKALNFIENKRIKYFAYCKVRKIVITNDINNSIL